MSMQFDNDKPIYLQLAGFVEEQILSGEWQAGDRIPSVREMASEVGVNPNTVARTFSQLQDSDLIYNQRGIGYFVQDKALQQIRDERRNTFIQEQLPDVFKTMDLLQITFDELTTYYEKFRNEHA